MFFFTTKDTITFMIDQDNGSDSRIVDNERGGSVASITTDGAGAMLY